MNIRIFNKNYWVRRFGEQEIVRGYIKTNHSDFVASLNVHPSSNDAIQANPEGLRKIKRLEAHGNDVLRPASQDAGVRGDLLFYHGDWYECISALEWDHTVLYHWNYEFVLVPRDAAGTIDLSEPEGSPDKHTGGDGNAG